LESQRIQNSMKKLIIISLLIAVAVGVGIFFSTKPTSNKTYSHLNPEQFNTELNTGSYSLLDIRTTDEFNTGHIKNATQIDYYQTEVFSKYLDNLDKTKKYLIYCRSGNRSGKAIEIMQQKGFTNVSDLTGGITAWTAANLSLE
jgi:rhodanese-related sulfurtransferase